MSKGYNENAQKIYDSIWKFSDMTNYDLMESLIMQGIDINSKKYRFTKLDNLKRLRQIWIITYERQLVKINRIKHRMNCIENLELINNQIELFLRNGAK